MSALDEIRGRLEAATPGPWERPLNTRYKASVTAVMPKGDPSSRWTNNVDQHGNPERVTVVSCPKWSTGKFIRPQSGRDLEFIAHAPTDVARLLAAVEVLDDLATAFEAEAAASENTAKEILSNDPKRGWVMVATEHEHHAVVARNHATRIREAVQAALGGAV